MVYEYPTVAPTRGAGGMPIMDEGELSERELDMVIGGLARAWMDTVYLIAGDVEPRTDGGTGSVTSV
jgi:hypothetical protein